MAYGIEQDRVACNPSGRICFSFVPVLRINAEIRDEKMDMWNLTLPLKKMERKAG